MRAYLDRWKIRHIKKLKKCIFAYHCYDENVITLTKTTRERINMYPDIDHGLLSDNENKKYYIILDGNMHYGGVQYQIGHNIAKNSDFCFYDLFDMASHIMAFDSNLLIYVVKMPRDKSMYKENTMYRAREIIIEPNPVKVGNFVDDNAEYFVENSRGLVLKYVDNQSEELCMKAVEKNGYVLEYVKNKTYNICIKAIETCPMALKYVDNQMYGMCLKAVQLDGLALQYVKCKTHKICETAVEENAMALQYVPEEIQTEVMCLSAVKKQWKALQYVFNKNKTYKVCTAALQKNPLSMKYINFCQMRDYLETGFVIFLGVIFLVGIEKLFVHHNRGLVK